MDYWKFFVYLIASSFPFIKFPKHLQALTSISNEALSITTWLSLLPLLLLLLFRIFPLCPFYLWRFLSLWLISICMCVYVIAVHYLPEAFQEFPVLILILSLSSKKLQFQVALTFLLEDYLHIYTHIYLWCGNDVIFGNRKCLCNVIYFNLEKVPKYCITLFSKTVYRNKITYIYNKNIKIYKIYKNNIFIYLRLLFLIVKLMPYIISLFKERSYQTFMFIWNFNGNLKRKGGFLYSCKNKYIMTNSSKGKAFWSAQDDC